MKAEQVAKQVLADEYSDYKKNSWHYDRQYVMIIKAIKMYECLNSTEKTPIMQVREAFEPIQKGHAKHDITPEQWIIDQWGEAWVRNQWDASDVISSLEEFAEAYHKERMDDLRDELIAFCCECNIELPKDKDYIDLVDGYLKTKS